MMSEAEVTSPPVGHATGVTWDLSDLFGGADDPRINETLDQARQEAEAFAQRFRGTINVPGGPEASVLLAALQRIEQAAGRVRTVRWGPRTLDLDIVMFRRQQVREPDLIVPHPELPNRDFWRRELAELGAAG
jgi:7,8-dihydro-6-hydroxymethylpterin-pyrophosphokinase